MTRSYKSEQLKVTNKTKTAEKAANTVKHYIFAAS